MKKIITLTVNPTIDINTAVESVIAERKLRCGPVSYEPGGGGLNVSRALKRMGAESLAIHTSGGATGETLGELLYKENIERTPIYTKNWTRENFIIFEESTGQQYRFGTPGPELNESEWKKCLQELFDYVEKGESDFIVASGSLPPKVPDRFYREVVRIGHQKGCKVFVDCSGQPLREALEEGVYLIKPNLRELSMLMDRDLENEEEQEQAALELVESGKSQVVIVSLGAAGAFLASNKGLQRFRAPTVKIRSKVGAGDSMVAGVTFGLARGDSLQQAVLRGIAAGAAAVMTPGTELCRGKDVERLYNQLVSQQL